ncbi:MAG: hypothetical protein N2645_02795 [Clostridia bacterium]|nr:hypothetical protein [Clostridia bacterium]
MKAKSKFKTFILSFFPGLGHVYLGFSVRGAVFFFAQVLVVSLILLTHEIFHTDEVVFLGFFIPVLWLSSIVDAMVLVEKVNRFIFAQGFRQDENLVELYKKDMEMQNKKVISMVLSIIPGAGHMYLGLQRQGIQLMIVFFLCFFLTDFLRIGLFIIFAPIIWFFGLFDAMHKASNSELEEDQNLIFITWFTGKTPFIRNTGKFIAYALIIIGCYLLFERIVLPELERFIEGKVRSYIQTAIVAFLFIAGGIKLLAGSKIESNDKEGDVNS